MRLPLLAILAASTSFPSCPFGSKETDPAPPIPLPTVTATASEAPSITASAAPMDPGTVCTTVREKVWSAGANKLTGLTAAPFADGRVAVGLAIGLSPHVLVVGKDGEGMLLKVAAREGTPLASVPADANRFLMRVTPVKIESDGARAFVDYRDEYKNKRRRVSCGPADGEEPWIWFDDVPLLDRDPLPGPAERARLFAKRDPDGDDGYHELRDCRSFADAIRGERWVVGSEMRADSKFGILRWKASLVVDSGPRAHEAHIYDVNLAGEKPKITLFEVPMLGRADDGFLLAARQGNRLAAALLGPNRRLRTKVITYEGSPTRPDIEMDGDDVVLVTSVRDKNDYSIRGLRFPAKERNLPAEMVPLAEPDAVVGSRSEPDFARDSTGRRWLAYIAGERGKGQLMIAPVDESFRVTGRSYAVTKAEDAAAEARLIPMADGHLFAVFLRDSSGKTELVTEELSCQVVPK